MKLLVTGGAGFIGSNFIHYILQKYPEDEIINVDALTYAGNRANCAQWEDDVRYTFVHGNICDTKMINQLIVSCDVVVHFAAESHVDHSIKKSDVFVQTNALGTHTLLEAARTHGNKRFHHISTDEVFGELGMNDGPFTENSSYDPRSPYAASKAASDHLVRAYYYTHNLPITISNCTNNYGPYHFPEKLIPMAITNMINNKQVPVYGQGSQIRDWLYVEDHCRAIDLIIRNGVIGETYGIGGDNQLTNLEVVKEIARILKRDSQKIIRFAKDRPGHDFRYDIDYSKIHKELEWSPSVTFQEGLARTVRWFQENETWWSARPPYSKL